MRLSVGISRGMYVLVQSTRVKSAENANHREWDAPYHCFDRDRVSLQLRRDEPDSRPNKAANPTRVRHETGAGWRSKI